MFETIFFKLYVFKYLFIYLLESYISHFKSPTTPQL